MSFQEDLELKASVYMAAAKLVKKSLRNTDRKAKFEEIFTLAVWFMQDDTETVPPKGKFGFHGGEDVEMDFPDEDVDEIGLDGDDFDEEDDE